MLKTYLAGPIRGPQDYAWRKCFTDHYSGKLTCLSPSDIGVDPAKLRKFGGSSYMTYRTDLALVDRAEIVVANLLPLDDGYLGTGTVFELGYARARNKHVIAVAGPKLKSHPFIAFGLDGVFDTWEALCKYLDEYLVVLSGYSPFFDEIKSGPERVGGCTK